VGQPRGRRKPPRRGRPSQRRSPDRQRRRNRKSRRSGRRQPRRPGREQQRPVPEGQHAAGQVGKNKSAGTTVYPDRLFTIAYAPARAESRASGLFPPASATSGQAPPEPPTLRATGPMILPSRTRLVRSLVTPTISAILVSSRPVRRIGFPLTPRDALRHPRASHDRTGDPARLAGDCAPCAGDPPALAPKSNAFRHHPSIQQTKGVGQ